VGEAPAGDVFTATRSAAADAEARRPEASIGVSEAIGTTPSGPANSAPTNTGSTRSGAFEPASDTMIHSFDAPEMSASKARATAFRPATAPLKRLSGSSGSSPIIRRAPRISQPVRISPFTSSSDCSVVASTARVDVT
jgi:hypothetical protein